MTDYSHLSDEDLKAIAGGQATGGLDHLSDEELMKIASKQPQPSIGEQTFGKGAVSDTLDTLGDTTTGVGQGITFGFGDELNAGLAAPFRAIARKVKAGDWAPPNLSDLGSAYDTELEHQRQILHDAQTRSPIAEGTGEVIGGVVGTGGASSTPMVAKGLVPRIIQGATEGVKRGVPAGAAYGFGTGEGGLENRAEGALWGAGLGAAGGVAVPVVAETVRKLASPITSVIKNFRNPDAAAAGEFAKMTERNQPSLSPSEFANAEKLGLPVTNIERYGLQSEAKKLANRSNTAAQTLQDATGERLSGRGERLNAFYRKWAGGDDSVAAREALDAEGHRDLKHLYKQAYDEGDQPIWTPRLKRLSESGEFQAAMKDAVTTGKSQAIFEGQTFKPTVKLDKDGNLLFRQVTKSGKPVNVPPNLQYWDYVKRSLQSAAKKASRSGDNQAAMRLNGFADDVKSTLERVSPTYKRTLARGRTLFGGRDALEDGEILFSRPSSDWRKMAVDHAKRTRSQKKLTAIGYADAVKKYLEKNGDKPAALRKLYGTPDARARAQLALGPNAAKELEAIMHVEGALGQFTGVKPNAILRTLAEAGIVGEGSSLLESGDFTLNPRKLMTGLLFAAAHRGHHRINRRVTDRLAEMLVSKDPTLHMKGIQAVVNDRRLMGLIRSLSQVSAVASGQQAEK